MGCLISIIQRVYPFASTHVSSAPKYVRDASQDQMKRLTTHLNCRNNTYLNGPKRFVVPDDKVTWSAEFKDYKPVQYTAPSVAKGPVWADKEVTGEKDSLAFNTKDGKTNRTSYYGNYGVVGGFPQNPVGRTGMIGRGLLGKWGPNHAADPVVTRFKKDDKGNVVKNKDSGKPVLEFVAIKRNDTGCWAIPGGMVECGDTVSLTLKKEFGEEALNSMEMDAKAAAETRKHLDELFTHGVDLYKGYVDDPRNTDNAWMETAAVNFHDKDGTFDSFKLHAGDDAGAVCWKVVDKSVKLFANHAMFVENAAVLNGAHW